MAKVYYTLNEEGRKQSIISGGDGKALQVIETENTKEIVELGHVMPSGEVYLYVGFEQIYNNQANGYVLTDLELDLKGKPVIRKRTESIEFSTVQTVKDLIVFEKTRRIRIADLQSSLEPEYEKALEEWSKVQAEEDRIREEENEKTQAIRERIKKENQEKQDKLEVEKLEWIKTYGSDYLKEAVSLGYACQRSYVDERLAKELPDFVVDYKENAYWEERACPSQDALKEVKKLLEQGYHAEIVWLTNPIDDDYEFEHQETIVIHKYLDKYRCLLV